MVGCTKLIDISKKILDLFLFAFWFRFDKVRFLISKGAIVGKGCTIITSCRNFGTEPYLIRIGHDVTITYGVLFVTHDGGTRIFRKNFPEMNRFGNAFAPIVLGNNVFVGLNSILLPGTKIGDNSLIGAGAVVKGTFEPGSVIAGNPGRTIGTIDEYIEKTMQRLVPLKATNRKELRTELQMYFSEEQLKRNTPVD